MDKKGFMHRPGDSFFDRTRYPTSRDWNMPEVKCGRKKCVANYNGKCTMPTLLEIGSDGKCIGFKKRKG